MKPSNDKSSDSASQPKKVETAAVASSLAPSVKGKQPLPIVKNEKIAQVFGDDDDDEVFDFHCYKY